MAPVGIGIFIFSVVPPSLGVLCERMTPSLGVLCERMTPTHAADWKVIGTLLGIPYEELKKIEASFPRNPECCCNKMWGKWFEIDSNATWNKLWAIILSLTLSCMDGKNGKCYCFICNLSPGVLVGQRNHKAG